MVAFMVGALIHPHSKGFQYSSSHLGWDGSDIFCYCFLKTIGYTVEKLGYRIPASNKSQSVKCGERGEREDKSGLRRIVPRTISYGFRPASQPSQPYEEIFLNLGKGELRHFDLKV